jgi:hypothetical protein
MTFNVRLNAYISSERERVVLQALYVRTLFPFSYFFLYKAVSLHDRCIGWCESEIGLVVLLLLFVRSLSNIVVLYGT